MNGYREHEGKTPYTLELCTRWMRVVSVKLCQLYTHGKIYRYALDSRLDMILGRSEKDGEKKTKNSFVLPEGML
jgi:hypothetical protein